MRDRPQRLYARDNAGRCQLIVGADDSGMMGGNTAPTAPFVPLLPEAPRAQSAELDGVVDGPSGAATATVAAGYLGLDHPEEGADAGKAYVFLGADLGAGEAC